MPNEGESRFLHPFWDRSIRFLLRRPPHLRAIISLCHPELASRLDFDRLETIDRSFILDDYRQREADLVVRVPYTSPAGQQDVIVYVLLEHQSTVDPWMPFRLLFYMLQILGRRTKTPASRWGGGGRGRGRDGAAFANRPRRVLHRQRPVDGRA